MAFCSTAAVLHCAKQITAPAAPARAGTGPPRATSSFNITPLADGGAAADGAAPLEATRAPATKVIASLGPASRDAAVLDALLCAGMSCARLDASNARPLAWHLETHDLLQARARGRLRVRGARGAARAGTPRHDTLGAILLSRRPWVAGAAARAARCAPRPLLRRGALSTRRASRLLARLLAHLHPPPRCVLMRRVSARRRLCRARGACAR